MLSDPRSQAFYRNLSIPSPTSHQLNGRHKDLERDDSMVIVAGDHGRSTMILNKEDYEEKNVCNVI